MSVNDKKKELNDQLDVALQEAKDVSRPFNPFNKKIEDLEERINRLKNERKLAAYAAYGRVHSIKCKLWEINEEVTQKRWESVVNEK